jgi:hypothetical protein
MTPTRVGRAKEAQMDRFKRVAIIALALLVLLTLTIPALAQEATPAATPEMLPETGGVGTPWAAVVIGAGVLVLAAGLALPLARRTR